MIMQGLFNNLFDVISLLKISLAVILTRIHQKPSVKGILRYQSRYTSGFTIPICIGTSSQFHSLVEESYVSR
jgi:hypothetical protein